MKRYIFLLASLICACIEIAAQTQGTDSLDRFNIRKSPYVIHVNTNSLAGKIEGQGDVTATGAATYQIPIDLPTGDNGWSPTLQISYNSQAGNGLLGYGWNLSGTSAITRCGKNPYYDGTASEIKMNAEDNLLLDGKRLILVSGANLESGAEYRFEDDPTTKVVCLETGFKLYRKDGSVYTYGTTPDSRIGSTVNWMWLLKNSRDLYGREINYTYENISNDEYYLLRIDYESNKSVVFTNETRPDMVDMYTGGQRYKMQKRLGGIKTYISNQQVKEYHLSYDFDGYYSKLTDITLLGNDSLSYNPTHIDYCGQSDGYSVAASFSVDKNGERIHYGDLNGDGRTDFISLPIKYEGDYNSSDYISIYLARTTYSYLGSEQVNQFEEVGRIQLNSLFRDTYISDIDGNGTLDIDIISCTTDGSKGHHIYYSIENEQVVEKNAFFIDRGTFLEGDYTGDGKTEYLNLLNKKLYDNNGHNIADASNVDLDDAFNTHSINLSEKKALDCNGNGKEDILIIGNNCLRLYELQGNIFSEVTSFYTNSINNSKKFTYADFNGDGYCDILSYGDRQCDLYLSNGKQFFFFTSFLTSEDSPVLPGDFNGDGKTDLFHLIYEDNEYKFVVELFNGTGFTPVISAAPVFPGNEAGINEYYFHSTIADFDGDGRSEFGCFCFNNHAIIKHFDDYQSLEVLNITDGAGLRTSFDYTSSSDPSVCPSDKVYSYPIAKPSGLLKIVSSMSVTGEVYQKTLKFTYSNPLIHKIRRCFLGFEKTTVADGLTTTETHFSLLPELDIPYPSYQEKRNKKDDLISKETNIMEVNWPDTSNPRLFIPYIRKSICHDYLTEKETTTITDIDAYANPTFVETKYSDGQTETTWTDYENITESAWILGLPIQAKTTKKNNIGTWTEGSSIEYNSNWFPVKIKAFKGDMQNAVSEETLSYDSQRNLTGRSILSYGATTPLTTTYTYTNDRVNLASVTDPYGQTTNYEYDNKGNLSSVTSSDGLVTTYDYDGMGRVTQENSNDGTQIQTTYAWDNEPGLLAICKTSQYNDGSEEKVWIEPGGLEIKSSKLDFKGKELKQLKYYDKYGRAIGGSAPFKGSSPSLSESWSYDDFGRITEKWLIGGGKESYSYNGDTVSVTKEGITTSRVYDAKGQVTSVTDPISSVYYKLRPDGQPSSVSASGVNTSFQYDSHGRRTAIVDPCGGTRSYEYNSEGLLSAKTDADGRTITIGYDLLGRMVAESMPGLSTTYTYDNHNRLTSVHSSNSTGYQCTYDSIGRITSRKDLLPDSKYLLREYTYNKGHISTIKYTNQNGVIGTENYSYAYGVLNKIDFSGHSVWELNAENDMGLHISEKLGSLLQGYTYDDHMHPSGIAVLKGRKFMYRQSFSIDPNTGNMLSRKDEIRGKEETFEYDAVNRLTNYSGNRMGYDDKGNILYKSDANLWMLYDDETRPYAATGIGEDYSTALVKSTPQRITYNAFECPDSIIDNDIITTFVYNAAGERVMMKTSRTNLPDRYYVGNLYMEHHTASSTTYSLFLGGNAYSAPAVYIVGKNGGTLYYIGRDYLGSIVALYKENGDKAFEYSYDPWGNLRDPATHRVYSQGENQTTILNRGFCGHEYLWWCGLINMNARLYDPFIGRFISPDPYVQAPNFSQNYNRYSYCMNNPLKYTDTDGKLWWTPLAIGAALFGIGNTVSHAIRGDINSFGNGIKYFGQGALAGACLGAMYQFSPSIPFVGNTLHSIMKLNYQIQAVGAGIGLVGTIPNAISKGWNGVWDGFKLTLGDFYLDENANFLEGALQGVSRHTWEMPQSTIGYVYSQLRYLFKCIDRVDFLGGATFTTEYVNNGHIGGVTLGNYINIWNDEYIDRDFDDYVISDPLYMHEYGHTLDSRRTGLGFLFDIGLKSLYSAATTSHEEHKHYWTEIRANRKAKGYFGQYYGVDWDAEIIYRGKKGTIESFYPTR